MLGGVGVVGGLGYLTIKYLMSESPAPEDEVVEKVDLIKTEILKDERNVVAAVKGGKKVLKSGF